MAVSATLLNPSRLSILEPVGQEGRIRIALVGLGPRGVLSALKKMLQYVEYDVVAVCDLRKSLVDKAVADLERDHEVKIRGYTSFDDLLAAEELDAVAIHVDADKQVPLACQAMEAGLHVMTEVPACYSLEHCWQLVTTVERTGKTYLLMEQTRFWGFIRAWRKIVQSGVIGKPIHVEGQYIGYYGTDFLFQDSAGRFCSAEDAAKRPDVKPTWRHNQHYIGYLPHTLSPLLYVLEDRVERVVGMGTQAPSYRHPNVKREDIEIALMHTEKDTVMKVAVGFGTPVFRRGETSHHWWGTKQVNPPSGAVASGHGGADYYVFAQFADAVLRDTPAELDVYKAVETAAPAILAGQSIDDENNPQVVPDFRPGPQRKAGEMPKTY